jgi:hypothetical protein
MPAPGWYDDPTGRHALRYWTGALWSRHVLNGREKAVELLDPSTVEESNGYAYSRFDDEAPPPRRVRHPRRRRVLAVLVVLIALASTAAVVLFADSPRASERDDEDIAEPIDPLVAALSEYIDNRSVGAVSPEDGRCMATKIVAAVGEARLVEVGVDAGADPLTALTPEEIQTGLPAVFDCLDDDAAVAFMSATFSPSALGQMNLQSADCLVEGWMARLGREKLIELFSIWAARQGSQLSAALDDTQLGMLADVVALCTTVGSSTTVPPG